MRVGGGEATTTDSGGGESKGGRLEASLRTGGVDGLNDHLYHRGSQRARIMVNVQAFLSMHTYHDPGESGHPHRHPSIHHSPSRLIMHDTPHLKGTVCSRCGGLLGGCGWALMESEGGLGGCQPVSVGKCKEHVVTNVVM